MTFNPPTGKHADGSECWAEGWCAQCYADGQAPVSTRETHTPTRCERCGTAEGANLGACSFGGYCTFMRRVDAVDAYAYASNAAAEPWNDADGAQRVADAAATVTAADGTVQPRGASLYARDRRGIARVCGDCWYVLRPGDYLPDAGADGTCSRCGQDSYQVNRVAWSEVDAAPID